LSVVLSFKNCWYAYCSTQRKIEKILFIIYLLINSNFPLFGLLVYENVYCSFIVQHELFTDLHLRLNCRNEFHNLLIFLKSGFFFILVRHFCAEVLICVSFAVDFLSESIKPIKNHIHNIQKSDKQLDIDLKVIKEQITNKLATMDDATNNVAQQVINQILELQMIAGTCKYKKLKTSTEAHTIFA